MYHDVDILLNLYIILILLILLHSIYSACMFHIDINHPHITMPDIYRVYAPILKYIYICTRLDFRLYFQLSANAREGVRHGLVSL